MDKVNEPQKEIDKLKYIQKRKEKAIIRFEKLEKLRLERLQN
jgi:hypothetical protein